VTAGNLVFQGRSDGQLAAYAADTGKKLWSFDAQTGIVGAPMTYKVAGRQYVSVLAGFAGGSALLEPGKWKAQTQPRRLLTFALDASAQLPPAPPRYELTPVTDPGFKHNLAREKLGSASFAEHCFLCHGYDAVAGGHAPDLRESGFILSAEGFAEIVKRGALRRYGMPQFEDLNASELGNIRQYLRARAQDAATLQSASKGAE
jgi:quinohemoprotein ethanol dehydrogenase